MCFRSAIHTVEPIELNFSDSPADGSAGNTIQISMDCITMHEPEETFTVSAHAFIVEGNMGNMGSTAAPVSSNCQPDSYKRLVQTVVCQADFPLLHLECPADLVFSHE